MTSFYDWYADLPVASPQVFGDQTDVPESGDWWDATYLMMWGSNVPVTRTPDAHWMAEVRYRGTKVVTVSPDYADNTKFADEWLPAQAGTDAALAMAMGHVILKEFFVDRRTPFFVDYVPHLHRPAVPGHASSSTTPSTGGLVPGKFLTAADLPGRHRRPGRRVEDGAAGRRHRRAGGAERLDGLPLRRVRRRASGTSTSRASSRRSRCATRRSRRSRPRCCCRHFVAPDGTGVGAAPRRPGRRGSATTWSPPSST